MAASGYTPILIYASGTATNVPLAANLTSSASGAELALNYADGKLYFKNSSGVVTLLSASGGGPAGGSNTQVQFNSSGVLAGSASFTWDGTTLVSPSHTTNTATTGSTNKGPLNYGTLNFSDTGIVQSAQTSVNSYFQNVIQNTSAGTAASAEFIAYNDQGTATTNYATVGINSSGYTGTGSINAPGYAYFLSASTDLVLGTIGANGIHFTTNSSATDALAISSAGAVSLPGGTANGVAYLNGSKVVTTGSALTFDGTNFATTGTGTIGSGQTLGTLYLVSNVASRGEISNNFSTDTFDVKQTASGGKFTFTIGSTEQMRLTTTGLLINTTSAVTGSKLVVAGADATIYGLTVGRGAGAVSTNTAVGASALAATNTGGYNTAIGYQSSTSSTGAARNTSVGWGSLRDTTSGTDLSATGFGALIQNTTGSYNTAHGAYSLYSNTTANNNTAVGYQAGYSHTTNGFLTAVGFQAAYSTNNDVTALGYQAAYNTTGSGNTAVGAYRTLYSNTSGTYNTAIGREALYSNTTASNNTAVGYQAAYSNTTGGLTAVGTFALQNNTTGSGNVAVGGYDSTTGYQAALRNNTTGIRNSAFGNGALTANTTANDNSAFGVLALGNNSTGANNTAMGSFALYSNTTASYNTAVGYQSGYSQTTGGNNTSFGATSLYSTTTGTLNTAIGQSSLNLNTTGSNNTAVGLQSLYNNTTASNNTAVGYQAGYGLTTGASNTYFGYAATQSGVAVTGEIVVGSSITGKGSNTAFIGGTSGAYNGANSTVWSITSDQRIKKNIVDNNTGLSVINQIQVRNFEYRLPEEITDLPQNQAIAKQGVQLGVIAQELEKVLPECVKTESTGLMTVDADNLTWYLVNAVKELSAQVAQLQSQLKG